MPPVAKLTGAWGPYTLAGTLTGSKSISLSPTPQASRRARSPASMVEDAFSGTGSVVLARRGCRRRRPVSDGRPLEPDPCSDASGKAENLRL